MNDAKRDWSWRKASGGWTLPNEHVTGRIFHAYDSSDDVACHPAYGLAASCEEPNEGSRFCPECMSIVLGLSVSR